MNYYYLLYNLKIIGAYYLFSFDRSRPGNSAKNQATGPGIELESFAC